MAGGKGLLCSAYLSMINQSPENLKVVDNGRQNPTLKQLGEELGNERGCWQEFEMSARESASDAITLSLSRR